MKKVFMILLATLLVLSTAGFVAAADNIQTINNSSLTQNQWVSAPVNVTLNLENDYVVTIPADFQLEYTEVNLVGASGKTKVYTSAHDNAPKVKVDITLLEADQNLTVKVNSTQYSDVQVPVHGGGTVDGSWTLTGTNSANTLQYLMAVNGGHLRPSNTYDDNQLTVKLADNSAWVFNDEEFINTHTSTTAELHLIVITSPTVVDTFTDQLTFTVELTE